MKGAALTPPLLLFFGTALPACSGSTARPAAATSDGGAESAGSGEGGSDLGGGTPGARPRPSVLALGAAHTCAILDNGQVKCWGANDQGQLGLGDTRDRGDEPGEMGDALPPVDLGAGRTAVSIAAGDQFTCALLDDGSLKCWGSNFGGVLGLRDSDARGDQPGEMGDALPAYDVGGSTEVTAIAAGALHACALLADGRVKCWGFGSGGQGDTRSRGNDPLDRGDTLPAVDLGTGQRASALAVGDEFACVVLDGGGVKCWGSNEYGQLGLGDTRSRGDDPDEMGDRLPAIELGTANRVRVLAAAGDHACVVLEPGAIKCWGWNVYGQLGLGDTEARGDQAGEMGVFLPALYLGAARTPAGLVAGDAHTCALLDDGRVKCWGEGHMLGLGSPDTRGDDPDETGDRLPALDLGAGRTVLELVSGSFRTCVVLDGGVLKCWGGNTSGALGLGDVDHRGDAPGEMGDALPAVDLGAGRSVRR